MQKNNIYVSIAKEIIKITGISVTSNICDEANKTKLKRVDLINWKYYELSGA